MTQTMRKTLSRVFRVLKFNFTPLFNTQKKYIYFTFRQYCSRVSSIIEFQVLKGMFFHPYMVSLISKNSKLSLVCSEMHLRTYLKLHQQKCCKEDTLILSNFFFKNISPKEIGRCTSIQM